ncbi:MAG TPA: NUDIX domain-containing protein [Candidatus Avipropionibacterium avicola]|uniref:NUDIX domain-containing protein n=1 Tax=Candidatus Avipropionibacterium avicola TaxID=2840701 RepID=A0A9D1KN25_9ACTN|nr:NUDIX domain-containing protein [Candidatus Avipropionibacterium avicola]
MGLRSMRAMTSVLLVREGQLLLLYRRGSRAIADSWVGIGGHIEPEESTDPTAAALRELSEEIGVEASQLTDLALRYVSLRDSGTELRTTHYFTAVLADDAVVPPTCDEGDLRWFALDAVPPDLPMPPTAHAAVHHWLTRGRHDDAVRLVVMPTGRDQAEVLNP